MKSILMISAAGLLLFAGPATAGESLKTGAYGGCGYGHSVKSVSTVPTSTPVPTKTASQSKTTPQSGG